LSGGTSCLVDLVTPSMDRQLFEYCGSTLGRQSLIRVLVGVIRNRDEDAAGAAAPQDGGRHGVRRVPPPPAQAVH
jgi:hypothetical protein